MIFSNFFKLNFWKKLEKQNLNLDEVYLRWEIITLKQDQNLDFWWILKWFVVDKVSCYLKENWFKDFIVNAWWDIYISWKNEKDEIPFVIIDNPFLEDDIFATLELSNKSISTSWTYKRNWQIDWKNYHHILNPNESINNDEIISVTIIADKCYLADTYATTCIAMWIEKSIFFLEKERIDYIIIWKDWKNYLSKSMSDYNLDILL